MVTDKLEEIVNLLTNVKYIRFEFWFFVIKISVSQWYKFKPQAMVKRAYSCIEHVLEEYLEYRNNEESNSKPLVPANEDEIFNGPAALDINDLEQKIIDMLPFYSSFMSTDELEKIVRYSHELKIDKIRIHVYEEKRDFEKCIDVYLHSDGWRTEEVFDWLKRLHKKQSLMEEEDIENIKSKILKVIQKLVKADSVKTGEVIDTWLPNSQIDIIDKLSSDPELQLRYLQDFLNEREEDIKKEILGTGHKSKSSLIVIDYKKLLNLHVKLLAEKKHEDLKAIVMKEYYPIDCLDDYQNTESVIVKQAIAYLWKRSGSIDKSLNIFLDLIQNMSYDQIKYDLMYANNVSSLL